MKPVLMKVEEEKQNTYGTESRVKKPRMKPRKQKKSSKPLICLEIGSHTLKIVEGQYKNNRVIIKKMCSMQINDQAIQNGKLIQKDSIGAGILNLLREARVQGKDIVCTMESSEVIRREMLIPCVDEDDIIGLLTYEIGQHLSINPESYIIQYKVPGGEAAGDGRQIRYIVYAMPRNLAAEYLDMIRGLHLKPYAMDTNTNALEKLLSLKSTVEFDYKRIVLIDMGHSHFHISFFRSGDCLFSKKLDIGGRLLNEVLLTNVEVGEREAEKLKIYNMSRISVLSLCAAYGSDAELTDSDDGSEVVLKGFTETIERWADEIGQVLKYIFRENGDIDTIYLYGGCSNICEIDRYFQERFHITTKCIRDINSITGKIDKEQISTYLNAICALIRN